LALHLFIFIFLLDEDPAGGKLVAKGLPFVAWASSPWKHGQDGRATILRRTKWGGK